MVLYEGFKMKLNEPYCKQRKYFFKSQIKLKQIETDGHPPWESVYLDKKPQDWIATNKDKRTEHILISGSSKYFICYWNYLGWEVTLKIKRQKSDVKNNTMIVKYGKACLSLPTSSQSRTNLTRQINISYSST